MADKIPVTRWQFNAFLIFGFALMVLDLSCSAYRGYLDGQLVLMAFYIFLNLIVVLVFSIFISPKVATSVLVLVSIVGLGVNIISAGTVIDTYQNSRQALDSNRDRLQKSIDSKMAQQRMLLSKWNKYENKELRIQAQSLGRSIAAEQSRLNKDITRRGSHSSTGFITWLGHYFGADEYDSNKFLNLIITWTITFANLAWWSFLRRLVVVESTEAKKSKSTNAKKKSQSIQGKPSGPKKRNVEQDGEALLRKVDPRKGPISTRETANLLGSASQKHRIAVRDYVNGRINSVRKLEGISL